MLRRESLEIVGRRQNCQQKELWVEIGHGMYDQRIIGGQSCGELKRYAEYRADWKLRRP